MEYSGLHMAKRILFNMFWMGYVLVLIAWFAYLSLRNSAFYDWLLMQWHITIPMGLMDSVTLIFFAMAKWMLVFCVLLPALGIWWTLRQLAKKAP